MVRPALRSTLDRKIHQKSWCQIGFLCGKTIIKYHWIRLNVYLCIAQSSIHTILRRASAFISTFKIQQRNQKSG